MPHPRSPPFFGMRFPAVSHPSILYVKITMNDARRLFRVSYALSVEDILKARPQDIQVKWVLQQESYETQVNQMESQYTAIARDFEFNKLSLTRCGSCLNVRAK